MGEVIDTGVVPRFVELLNETSRADLRLEMACVLVNIAAGTAEQTRIVVESGALSAFLDLLQPSSDHVCKQTSDDHVRKLAVWFLGHLAATFRDLVLQTGGLELVMKALAAVSNSVDNLFMIRHLTWALAHLCSSEPPPPFGWVSPALPTLAQLLRSADCEVLAHACWALSSLSDGPGQHVKAVIEALIQEGVCQRLVELLLHSSPLIQRPAVWVVGNITNGHFSQAQVVLQSGVLPALQKLLWHTNKTIQKAACWTIANITAGSRDQVQAVIEHNLFPSVIQLLQTADFQVKAEAAWIVRNATFRGAAHHIEYLVSCGCIKSMLDLLARCDIQVELIVLQALENILKAGKAKQQERGLPENPYFPLIEQADGASKIDQLHDHPNIEVYEKAMYILDHYFPPDSVDVVDEVVQESLESLNFE